MLKDRRKQWQKDCINYSWSRCGTIATERKDENPTRLKRAKSMFKSGDYPTLFSWCGCAKKRGYVVTWDKFNIYQKEAA